MVMSSIVRRVMLAAGSVLLLSLLFGFRLPGGVALSLTPVRGGAPLAVIWLAPEETFTIRYNVNLF